jgi:hypothetical protein
LNRALNLLANCLVYPNEEEKSKHAPRRRAQLTMNRKIHIPITLTVALMTVAWLLGATSAQAQVPSKFVGSVTAISGTSVTVKTDAGDQRQFDVPADANIKRIAPGEKDLSKAAAMAFTDLAVGDRVLVKLATDASTPAAAQIIAVKQEDLAKKQQKDRDDWQRHGVGGLVKSVDAGTGTISLTTGAGATAKTVTVHTTKATILKRYAPDSVRFDQAQPAPLDSIHSGDQLRARGDKNADGTEITAEEVVSGSFRNISGTISSIDPAASTLVIKDLATKKQVTVRITSDAQMRRLPDRMAQMLATRLKGGAAGSGAGGPGAAGSGSAGSGPAQPGAPSAGPGGPGPAAASAQPASGSPQQHSFNGGGGPGGAPNAASGAAGAPSGQAGGGDPQQMLNRAPAIQLSDLQKGEAVMIVSTEGANEVSAVTLLAGVEPLLQAPAASQNLLSNWSMGSGGGAEGAATP